MNKKILAILMTVCMVVTMIPVVAFADSQVEKIWGDGDSASNTDDFSRAEAMLQTLDINKEVYYHDIDNAIAAANSADAISKKVTIYPLSYMVDFDDKLVFDGNNDVVIDLAKCKMSSETVEPRFISIDKDIKVKNGTWLTLKGGIFYLDRNGEGNTIHVAGQLYIKEGAGVSGGTTPVIVADAIVGSSYVRIGGWVNSNGDTIKIKNNVTVDINEDNPPDGGGKGGLVNSTGGIAIVQTGLTSKLNIFKGQVYGYKNAVKVLGGSLTIYSYNESREVVVRSAGDAIVIHKGTTNVSIEGNTVYPSVGSDNPNEYNAIKTYGRIYNGFIKGGRYNEDVSEYVADGYEVKEIEVENLTYHNYIRWVVAKKSDLNSDYSVKVIGTNFIDIGLPICPLVRVTKGGKLVLPSEYTVAYENNNKSGTATVKVSVGGTEVASTDFTIKENKLLSLISSDKTSTLQLAKDSNTLQIKDSATELPQNTLGDTDDETSFIDTIATKIKEVAENVEYLLTSPDLQKELKAALEDARKVWAELIAIIGNSTN